jgi:FAD/FMN-containing dehydrogenase
VIAANEAQAEAFWRIRDSLSEAERAAFGPATQHDISVAVDDMPRFIAEAAAEVEAASPAPIARASAISATATSTSTSAPAGHAAPDWLRARGESGGRVDHPPNMVDDLVTAAGGSISAEHGIGQMKRERASPANVSRFALMTCTALGCWTMTARRRRPPTFRPARREARCSMAPRPSRKS